MKIELQENNDYNLDNFGASLWLKKALEVLSSEGIDSVKVEDLAKRLGKTKGSFYHFFKNREELLNAILDYYGDIFHYETRNFYDSLDGSPRDKLWKAFQFRLKLKNRNLDLAIQAWARKDNRAVEKYETILLDAISKITSLFLEMGFNEEEALIRSRMILSIVRGDDYDKIQKIDEDKSRRLLRLQYELLTSRS